MKNAEMILKTKDFFVLKYTDYLLLIDIDKHDFGIFVTKFCLNRTI